MTDKELLELAAKAAGIDLGDWSSAEDGFIRYHFITRHIWNPLTDDGDALRLAVTLRLVIQTPTSDTDCALVKQSQNVFVAGTDAEGLDVYDSTRKAIVRAAAEIGKAMT